MQNGGITGEQLLKPSKAPKVKPSSFLTQKRNPNDTAALQQEPRTTCLSHDIT